MKLNVEDKKINYKLERKKRKTVSIRITEIGEVLISAPLYLGSDKIEEIIEKRSDWILSKLEEIKAANPKERNNLLTGGKLKFFGQEYNLNIFDTVNSNIEIIFDRKSFSVYVPKAVKENKEEYIKAALIQWYRIRAEKIFQERTRLYAKKLNVFPNRIVIKDQKTKWGSCSSKGNINFNYRVIMAPIEIIDYLVVHELCHLVHMNHSKDFWNLVGSICPNYKSCKEWLKINGSSLSI